MEIIGSMIYLYIQLPSGQIDSGKILSEEIEMKFLSKLNI